VVMIEGRAKAAWISYAVADQTQGDACVFSFFLAEVMMWMWGGLCHCVRVVDDDGLLDSSSGGGQLWCMLCFLI